MHESVEFDSESPCQQSANAWLVNTADKVQAG
jgi:hypothetical protein